MEDRQDLHCRTRPWHVVASRLLAGLPDCPFIAIIFRTFFGRLEKQPQKLHNGNLNWLRHFALPFPPKFDASMKDFSEGLTVGIGARMTRMGFEIANLPTSAGTTGGRQSILRKH